MSVLYDISSLSPSKRTSLVDDLTLTEKETKYNKNPKSVLLARFTSESSEARDEKLLIPCRGLREA